jgi:hypothetical protein
MRPSWSSSSNCGMRNCWSICRSKLRKRSRWLWQYWVIQYYVHQTFSLLLHYDSSKHRVHPLYTFVYSFKFVKLFLKHPVLKHYEEFHVLGYNALLSVESQPTFRRNISHPSSGSKNKPSKEPANSSCLITASCWFLT